MNIKDFKNVTTKPCDIDLDKDYLEKLSQLPKTAPRRHTLEIVSTVASAVLIVLAVSLWAIIGRGVRSDAVKIVAGSYTEIPITDELNAELNLNLFGKYDVFCFREFDQKNPLSVHEILQINRYAENAMSAHDPVTHGAYTTSANGDLAYLTGKEINEYAKNMFGITPADEGATYGCSVELGEVDYAGAKVDKITTEDLTDGTKKIRIEYNMMLKPRVVEYIGYDLFTPICFTAFYRDDTELSKDYADEKIYKVLCDELDATEYIESYLLYISEAPTQTEDGYSANIMLTPTFTDGQPHSVLGTVNEYENGKTATLTLKFENTENGLKLIKEKADGQSVFIHEIEISAKIYKVSSEDAEYLSELVKKEGAADTCYCMPTHSIVVEDKAYNVVMGDEFASHITCDGKKYTLSPDEFTKLSGIFEKSITKQNFITYVKDREDYKSSGATEIKVTVNDDLMPQRNGSYTISGEYVESLIGWIEENAYAHDTLKFLPSVKLEIGERTYYLHMGDEPFLRSSCGQYPLASDSPVIRYVQNYTGYGWNGDGRGFYETEDGYYVTSDGGKTFEKYITRKQAIRFANAEAKQDKYDYQGWDSDFYLDENTKDIPDTALTTDYSEGIWVKEWQTEDFSEGALCWEIWLRDKNDALTSLIMYIDAKTGNVVGAAELSD